MLKIYIFLKKLIKGTIEKDRRKNMKTEKHTSEIVYIFAFLGCYPALIGS